MSRRTTVPAILLGVVAVLSLALPTLAKEGAEAMLDTEIPRDAPPGSTIDVGWSVFSVSGTERQPMYGSPVYIRLVSVDRTTSTEVMGTESPSGSGHYVASIEVPAGGIGEVVVGLVGEACSANGCKRSDMIFPLTDDALVTGAAPVAPVAPTPLSPPSGPMGSQLLPLVALGVGFAVVGGLAALLIGRRRLIGTDPTGR
jgi:hypothetical protein